MKFAYGAKTDVGRGRPANEDAFLVDEAGGLYAVADGMGGHRAGEVASATAIATLQTAFGAGRSLDEAVGEANAAVFAKAEANLDMRGMGTTLTAVALLDDHTALLGHVGDSRAYLTRDGGVTQVTEDHSLVEQLVREGRLSPEEALGHPQRAIITRALGVDSEVEVDLYEIDLRGGDRLLLCSDGLTTMVADEAIAGVLRGQRDPQRAAETLVAMANEAGGDDNITVVVIDALGDPAAEGISASAALAGARTPDEPTGEWVAFEEEPEAEAESVPEDDAVPEAGIEADEPARVRRPRLPPGVGRRLLVWLLPILVLVGGGLSAVGWYARRTFFVGLAGEQVTLYRGVPGGLLGWDPTVEERSGLTVDELTPAQRADLEDGHRFSSRSSAERFLERLEDQRRVTATEDTTGTSTRAISTTTTTTPSRP